jgi:hypothetical protein
MGHFEAGFRRHTRNMAPPRNDPAGTECSAQPDRVSQVVQTLRSTTEIPMSNPNQNPGQQNQNPGQKPGQQQGGGQKPGQQQQDPSRQKPNPDQRAGQ